MQRTKVLKRSKTISRRQPQSAEICSKSNKRQRTAPAAQQDELGSQAKRLQQDQGQTFELPPLAQLLSDVDQEQDDDNIFFLPLHSHAALYHADGSDANPAAFGNTSELQNCENAGANPTGAKLNVMSLPQVAVQPAQQFHSGRDSQHCASGSPAALQHFHDAQQQSLQQADFGLAPPSGPSGWPVDGQRSQAPPSDAQPIHAANTRAMPHDILLPEEPFSPHTLQSMFNMPALSFDSSQHVPEDDTFASTTQSQQQQAADYQYHSLHQQQQQLHGNFEGSLADDLQPHHSYSRASSSMGDLQWTDSCPAPRNLPNVIRKISSDSTIDPNTGKLLVYGKAMAHRNVDVELPTVAALFTDMNARVSQKSWQSSSRPHARSGTLAAKAARRQRISSSMPQASLTAPQQDHALQGSVDVLQQYHQPIPAPQFHHVNHQAPYTGVPFQSYSIAAPEAPHTSVSDPAMQYTAVAEPHGHGHWASSGQLQPSPTYSPEIGPVTATGSQMQFTGVVQQPLHTHAAQMLALGQMQQPAAIAEHLNTGHNIPNSVGEFAHMPAGSGEVAAVNVAASTPAKMRFGGILSGVVKEAAETATKRPPVFRYEDFKSANEGDSFRGVSRDRWSVQWNASIPKADKDEGEHFLGRFSQQTTAARACDVANLKVHGAGAATHFPAREYEDGMEELAPVSVLDVVMALQRQGAIGQFKNSRYQGVWQLDRSCWEARLEEALTQESSTSDRPSANGEQSRLQPDS